MSDLEKGKKEQGNSEAEDPVSPEESRSNSRPLRVFLSHSHEDSRWADRLYRFLLPQVRADQCSFWDDRKIAPGSKWRDEIGAQLEQAQIIVLLVSPSFLSS